MKKTCFIIGNGPSHNRAPMDLPEDVGTFGMNYAGFVPTYYVCVDQDIIAHHADEIRQYVAGAGIAYLSEYLCGSNTLYDYANVQLVGKDTQSFKAEDFMSGYTAAYVCLKMAYYLGYEQVHLYGIDHSPAWEHYRPDYRIGKKTDRRCMQIMETHYQLAANVYARAGREIFNHSDPSRLDKIFRRV